MTFRHYNMLGNKIQTQTSDYLHSFSNMKEIVVEYIKKERKRKKTRACLCSFWC